MLSALSAVFILSMFIPKVANIFDRFMDEENIMALGNRDSLWKYFLLMGEKYPVFGAGFGSYNQFAYDNGLRVGGDRWNFNGHNCCFHIFKTDCVYLVFLNRSRSSYCKETQY